MQAPLVLEMKDVRKAHAAGAEVLRGLDLAVPRGEWVAIVGAAGAGKTTLAHVAALLEPIDGGAYRLDREDVVRLPERRRTHLRGAKVGLLFPDIRLSPELNVLESVEVPLLYRGDDPKVRAAKVATAVGRVGLAGLARARTTALTAEQRQRAALARALVAGPRLLLADEPTAALDAGEAEDLMALIEALAQEDGFAVVLFTRARSLSGRATRVLLLDEGRLRPLPGEGEARC